MTSTAHCTDYSGFSWTRLKHAIWNDATRSIEFAFGLFFYIFRGLFLVQYGYNDSHFERFLLTVHLSAIRVGLLCLLCGTLHIYACATNHRLFRILVSAGGMALGVSVNVAIHGSDDPTWQAIAALWLTVVLFECYIALRNFLPTYDPD